MNGFKKSVGWSEEHNFRANQLKRQRKERKRKKSFHKQKNINRNISEVEVVIHTSFRVEAIMHFLFVFNTRSFFFRFEDRETRYPIQ